MKNLEPPKKTRGRGREKMKFGKELRSQMVPEWQEAYMNYGVLKTILKEIHGFKLTRRNLTSTTTHTPRGGQRTNRILTLSRAFSGLTGRYSNLNSPSTSEGGGDISEDEVILIQNDVSEQVGHQYQTKFLMSSDEGGEYELVYFRRLDDEFNKVNKFYQEKVEQVMKEAGLLNKQMDAMIAFRIKVDNPDGITMRSDLLIEMTQLASNVAATAAAVTATSPAAAVAAADATTTSSSTTTAVAASLKSETVHQEGRGMHMDATEEIELIEGQKEDSRDDPAHDTEPIHTSSSSSNSSHVGEAKPKNKNSIIRPAWLEILDHVTINNTLETPRSTIKGILNIAKNKELKFGRENLRKVEKQLLWAFVEFYQKLRLLKSYSFLNTLAFSKIMKKYDKITSRSASKSYLKMVDNSYLGNTDAVTQLIERVEATVIKHFTNSNRTKGMKILRPKAKREKHIISFSLGLITGCTAALLVSLILIIRARNLKDHEGSTQYMENLFPLYSLFGFIFLHMLMYAMNIYTWRLYRVNYQFIFGFKQGTELGYREVFLVSACLASLALATVLVNLDMEMDVNTKKYNNALSELVPLALLALIFLITICPFNIIYRSSRYFLIRCAYHCICAPLYKVLLPDFFLADQLTSQVQAIRSIEFYICYYVWGDFERRENTCKKFEVYNVFNFIIATIPYWSRFLQCLRRLIEEKEAIQGYNALKYLSTIVAIVMRTAYTRSIRKKEAATVWLVLAWVSSVVAAIAGTYWDIVIDWGLLQRHSKNRWLRDKLLVSQKSVYFGAMVLNVLLRFAWLQTVLNFQVSFLHMEALIAIVASLEIVRRGIWNFFRLENEHLNNVGKYRAFKSVPLPFNYDEDEEKDE